MERLTDAEIAELERLEKAATPGPFAVDHDLRQGGADQLIEIATPRHLTIAFGTSDGNENDLSLLAMVRNLLPRLLAELRERRAAEKSDTCPHCEMRYADCFCGGEAKGGAK